MSAESCSCSLKSKDGWTEWFNAAGLGSDLRLTQLRRQWRRDARAEHLAALEWKASMENRAPVVRDGMERHAENLSTRDLSRLIDIAFTNATKLASADPDSYDTALREALRDFDTMRARYVLPAEPDITMPRVTNSHANTR